MWRYKDAFHGFSAKEHFVAHFFSVSEGDVDIPGFVPDGNRASDHIAQLGLAIGAGDFAVINDLGLTFHDFFGVALIGACFEFYEAGAIDFERLDVKGV